jgi:hypothetical protein
LAQISFSAPYFRTPMCFPDCEKPSFTPILGKIRVL